MRRMRWAALACVGAMALTSCGADPATDASAQVDFSPCSDIACSGTLDSGAEFEILLPEDWGGSLAIFSRGQKLPETGTVTGAVGSQSGTNDSDASDASPTATMSAEAVEGGPEPAPLWSGSDKSIADAMLQAGYAIAGASPPQAGWAVGAQVIAAEELHEYFVENVAEPNRIYVWGNSTGGLASVRLAELHPDWVSGAAAMCAPMAGPRPTFDLALDVSYAVKQLLLPKMKLVDYSSAAEAQAAFDQAAAAVSQLAASGKAADRAKLVFIAGIGQLPDRNRTQSGNSPSSRLAAYTAGVLTQIRHSTIERFTFGQTVGGNASGNEGTDYSLRLTPAVSAEIEQIAPGKLAGMYKAMAKGDRITPDPKAEKGAAAQGELVGNLELPVLSLQNAYDSTFIAQSQSWYRVRTEQNGTEAAADFVELYAIPPVSYTPDVPAPEGAGNCVFTPRTVLGVMILLNDWVRRGQYPGRDTVGEAFARRQITITYDPGPWPQMTLSPEAPPIAVPPEIGAT